ncbi:type II secretion system protein [Neobacillus vireti]|uniref:type II secretion system protein n=1 Tax=Neobacillus vireti TaxID=220686 RepID=UPI0030007EA1
MVQALKAKMKEQKGFTLIELLAVIVILGIIAAIAIPAIGNVITKSDNKAKVQDALLIINAAKLYVADQRPTGNTILTVDGTTPATIYDTTATTPTVASLDAYLDRVADKSFQVSVIPSLASDGTTKYTYRLSNHDAVKVVNSSTDKTATVTEKKLSEYK